MTLKRLLIVPLIVSIGLFIYFSDEVKRTIGVLQDSVVITSGFIGIIALSVALQIAGHSIRAIKMRYLMKPIVKTSMRFQFRALSVGYLFNALLPFRLGELIRAQIIAGAEKISFGYALSLVIVERILDALFLGVLCLLVLVPAGIASSAAIRHGALLVLIALVAAMTIALIIRQNLRLFLLWHRVTEWFNTGIKVAMRFKAWSIIYGLQQSVTRKRAAAYLGLTAASWGLYLLSIFVVAAYLFPAAGISDKLGMSPSPYYGVSVPSGPANLGSYSPIAGIYTSGVALADRQRLEFNLISWAILIIPISLLGLIFFFVKTRETVWRRMSPPSTNSAFSNKLRRTDDISPDMANFLDNYFSGNTLSHIVHRLERSDNFRLLKYFKGGSDAITILALQDGREIVKKIIPLEYEDRLRAQRDWLKKHDGSQGIVRLLGDEKTADYYAIDLDYDPANEMFYEYIHRKQLRDSKRIMDQTWDRLMKSVYGKPGKLAEHPKERDAYIEKHIFGCLEKAAAVDPNLIKAAEHEMLIINGRTYDNLYQVMDRIRNHPQAWKDIATYRESAILHGDVIVDNLLVSKKTDQVLIIDPAPDGNIINGPVFDFGKNMQSLYCGYESLLRDEDMVHLEGNEIAYRDHRTEKYRQLASYVRKDLAAKYLSEAEQKAILFHAGALYIRRLKHQVYYTPANVLKFYAVGVKTLNDFLAQYDGKQ